MHMEHTIAKDAFSGLSAIMQFTMQFALQFVMMNSLCVI